MTTLRIERPRGFRLGAAASFYAGFVPGSGMAAAGAGPANLTLAFRLDRTFEAVAARLHEDEDVLVAEVVGTNDAAAVARQVSRILGLEGDAEAWAAVGAHDPVVGRLHAEFPGFFTAAKP